MSSLLDKNFDFEITRRTLYELEVKKQFKTSIYNGNHIDKIYYHTRVKYDNWWKWLMYYNKTTYEIKFFNVSQQPGRPWEPVYVPGEYGTRWIISLHEIFNNLNDYEK